MSNFIETTEIDYEKLFTIFNNIDKTNSKYKNFKMIHCKLFFLEIKIYNNIN